MTDASMRGGSAHGPRASLLALAFGALGVVYGDIGTSPLYALKECLNPPKDEHDPRVLAMHAATPENVLGILSLMFWSLTLVVTLKYVIFITRADNRGEGGILALLALVPDRLTAGKRRVGWIAALVIVGAALLYGDGMITPAISVLSAMEGLEVATDRLKDFVVPITCAILVLLFVIQRRGTGGIGRLFGPVMLVWFLTIGGLGLYHLTKNPSVLRALSPTYGVQYFATHGLHGGLILGGVVLCVTGGEALYADMGHFGARPIRVAWLALVKPALILAYFGQGAILLADPSAAKNPFFAMVPTGPFTYALTILSSLATVIASQALISGAFSLTHQAVQLGYFPRVTVKHTSHEAEGQIYIPEINWALALACVALVLKFKESGALAAAYGIAVAGTMAITSVIYFLVARHTWRWPLWASGGLLVLFLSFDLPFLAANALKFLDGGFVPVVVAALLTVAMVIWRIGRSVLGETLRSRSTPVGDFVATLEERIVSRTPGTAIFMASLSDGVPPPMLHFVRRVRVLRERVVLLTVLVEHVPTVADEDRLRTEELGKGIVRVVARYGFMETPEVPALLARANERFELGLDLRDATYFLGREIFLATSKGKMGAFSEAIFSFLSRNAKNASSHFSIPPDQVVELGTQIDL